MIIDVHQHWEPEFMLKDFIPFICKFIQDMYISLKCPPVSLEEIEKEYSYLANDPYGERLVEHMEKSGVDKAVVFVWDRPAFTDETIMETNKRIGEMGRRFPEKLIPFASINPTREKAPEMLKKCIEDYGLKGMKWHPDVPPFNPSDKKNYPLLKVMDDYKLTLITHTGSLPIPSKGLYAHPLLLDEILVDFPNINIIAAHSGWRWWPELAGIMEWKPRIYGCLTEWQLLAVADYDKFCRTLRSMIDQMGIDRLMWGTDNPSFTALVPVKKWIEIIQGLPENAPEGIHFTREEVEAILGGNAQRLFNITA
ncbi:MAG TPA: amidohydrolase family protein [Bacillota bacterium]|mgnify:CR=1 FL=1|jgi:predicted TIM-barrel fold metal-dependent hydrolase|nr:amidohydrolase [Bacillota bacterium]HOB86478.1 amidohydrolase family protein [Bacillota bacterium]HOP68783.1 amidohydrolase family protein [Bacillota bacterium]HPT33850.1 amidohydrolase family protein [Bacillota bacterium]HQD06450.1 amidohydrolase family protein [Bacillota bacterium]